MCGKIHCAKSPYSLIEFEPFHQEWPILPSQDAAKGGLVSFDFQHVMKIRGGRSIGSFGSCPE